MDRDPFISFLPEVLSIERWRQVDKALGIMRANLEPSVYRLLFTALSKSFVVKIEQQFVGIEEMPVYDQNLLEAYKPNVIDYLYEDLAYTFNRWPAKQMPLNHPALMSYEKAEIMEAANRALNSKNIIHCEWCGIDYVADLSVGKVIGCSMCGGPCTNATWKWYPKFKVESSAAESWRNNMTIWGA